MKTASVDAIRQGPPRDGRPEGVRGGAVTVQKAEGQLHGVLQPIIRVRIGDAWAEVNGAELVRAITEVCR